MPSKPVSSKIVSSKVTSARSHFQSNCALCAIQEKICKKKDGRGPAGCPTINEEAILKEVLKEYRKEDIKKFIRAVGIQISEGYSKPGVLGPGRTAIKSRVEEIIEFAQRMGFKKIGIAFCTALHYEASLFAKILANNGLQVISVGCKTGRIPKEEIGIKDEEKKFSGQFEVMCNPIGQAKILNKAKTDFNVLLGLCLGDDSLFIRYIKGWTTILAVKDRLTGHNPLAALYTSHSFYQRLLKKEN